MGLVNIVPPGTSKPQSQTRNPVGKFILIRDQFTISTWLCIGATLQIAAWLLVPRTLALVVFAPGLLLLFRAIDTALMLLGLTRNQPMDGVIMKKFTAQIPDTDGTFSGTVADQSVTVILLGARVNHPLGLLAPGAKDMGDYFAAMVQHLDADGDPYGYLGATSWISASHRATANEFMTVLYFRTRAGLHAFAHAPAHREGWDWWNRTYRRHPHLGIMHEVYEVPRGMWENVYANYHPSGIAATAFRRPAPEERPGEPEVWLSPIVDASRGTLRTHAGRMGLSAGDDNEKYGKQSYETG